MSLVSAKCPNCGANIQVDNDRTECFCSFCGSKIQTQEAVSLVVKIDKSTDFKNYLRLAKENAEMSQFDDAISYIEKALEIHPDSAQAWMLKSFYTSQCREVEASSTGIIEPGYVFYGEEHKKVLVSGQKAIKYASSDADAGIYASLAYRLFLGITKATLELTIENANNQDWLHARYEELENICYPGQIAHWGQHEHEEILANEDAENFNALIGSMDNAISFLKAVPKEFVTEEYYGVLKEISSLYAAGFKAINQRIGVYNSNLSDEYLKHSKDMIALINSYLPEEENATEEIDNTKQTETNVVGIVISVFLFIFLMVIMFVVML